MLDIGSMIIIINVDRFRGSSRVCEDLILLQIILKSQVTFGQF